MERPTTREEVERLNDAFAREHNIDDYYARSGLLIGFIERRRLQIIEQMMNAKPGERILEVGCGGGHVLARFAQARVTGVDVSEEMLATARKNLAGRDAELLKGELGDLALPDRSFDGIVCTEVLEHVVDPDEVLRHIQRLVKPTGRVVITFPNDNLINGLKDAIRKTGLTALPPFRRVNWGGDHYHFHVWSRHEMRALLSRYWSVVSEEYAPFASLPIRCCFLCVPRQ
jgi:2-polyprenyl-3-methyl-5-hydroxy-6-metoxy-1,4-benzoquinol methylase